MAALPRGSGFVFRHYHLPGAERRQRFDALALLCRSREHIVVLADQPAVAIEWGADGVYGSPGQVGERSGLLRLATVHSAEEIVLADSLQVDALFLSPVFPTRSHPGSDTLGKERFFTLASTAKAPVIALGGMNAERAAELGWPRWAAIDGLSETKRDS